MLADTRGAELDPCPIHAVQGLSSKSEGKRGMSVATSTSLGEAARAIMPTSCGDLEYASAPGAC